jgi:hypothetical protein
LEVKMTKDEFKKRWESDDRGGGITFGDIADCAEKWGLFSRPRTCDIQVVRFEVLKAANTNDYEDFRPSTYD